MKNCTLTLHGTSPKYPTRLDFFFSRKPSLELVLRNHALQQMGKTITSWASRVVGDREVRQRSDSVDHKAIPPQNSFEDDFPLEKVRHVPWRVFKSQRVDCAGQFSTWIGVRSRCSWKVSLNIKIGYSPLEFKSYRYPTVAMFERKKGTVSFSIPMMFKFHLGGISWKFPQSENPARDSTHHQPNFIVAGNLGERSFALDWWCCLKCRWSYRLGLAGRFKYLGQLRRGVRPRCWTHWGGGLFQGLQVREKVERKQYAGDGGSIGSPIQKIQEGSYWDVQYFYFPFAKWKMWGREVQE